MKKRQEKQELFSADAVYTGKGPALEGRARMKEDGPMKRSVLACFLTLMMLLTLTACGGAKSEEATASNSAAMDSWTEAETPAAPAEDMVYGGGVKYEEAVSAESQTESGTVAQKLICTAWLEMETTEFDTATAALTDLTEQLQGYFESSTVGERGSGSRWAEYTIRVPAEKYRTFLNQAGELCHETWRNTSQENVTESYYDTQGRLRTQQIKLERLQALLAKAELMEDIITIESAISETEWTIESLSGTLRHYDALVDYATVHINLTEVYKLSDVEQVPDSFGARLGEAFRNGWSSFTNGLENLAVALAYGWMWVLVLAVAAVAVIRVLRRRRRARKAQQKQESPAQK